MDNRNPLLKTKIAAPRLRGRTVSRPRLLSLMAEGVERSLTLICAPAGYGKTTLLAEWLSSFQEKQRVGWLSLDEGDNDPTRFLNYLVAALENANPQMGGEARSVLSSFPAPPFQTVLAILINDLCRLDETAYLVLDDYQFITNPALQDGVAFFLERLPSTLRLVIATRSDPPLPLARLRARDQMLEIRVEQLRFTPDEAAAFLNHVMSLPLSPQDIQALENRTEGWIAGLQMAALALQAKLAPQAGLAPQPDLSIQDRGESALTQFIQAFSGSHRFILDYLVEEIFNRQTADVQNFLLSTSILDRMCASLCDEVLSVSTLERSNVPTFQRSNEILDYLDRANLFVVALDDERRWYRYHRLFADLLRLRLYQSQPGRVLELHRRAVAWFDHNGYPNEAVQHAFSAEDYELAAGLIERWGPVRWSESDPSIVQMAGRLPEELLIARPRLGLYQAWFLIGQGHIGRAIPLLQDLARRLSAGGPGPGMQWMQSVVALVLAFISQQKEAIPDYQELEKIPEEDAILRNAADILYALLLGRRDQLDLAAQILAQCVQREKTRSGGLAIPSAVPLLVRIRLLQGQLHQAEALCRETLGARRETGTHLIYAAGSIRIALGEVLYEWNNLDEAEEQIRAGIRENEPWDNLTTDAIGYLVLARVLQANDDPAGALEAAQKLEKRLQGHAPPLQLEDEVSTLRARLLLANGDLPGAAAWAHQIHLSEPFDIRQEHYRLTLARIRLAQGSFAEAEQLLTEMAYQAAAGKRAARQMKCELLLAIALSGQSRHSEAVRRLAACLALAEPEGYIRLFLDAGEPAKQLLTRHLQTPQPACQAYAQRLVGAFARPPAAPTGAAAAEELFEPLTSRELDVLRLLAQGYSNRQVAAELVLAEGTVKFYVHAILEKLGVHSRTQAIAKARELRLLDVD